MSDMLSESREPLSLFILAIATRRSQEVIFLLDQGLDVNSTGRNGMTGLHWAAAFGDEHVEVAHLLLHSGANVDARSKTGTTPLMEAVCNGHVAMASLLIEAGAEVNLRAYDMPESGWRTGRTALGMAQDSEYLPRLEGGQRQRRILNLLLEAGAHE